MYDPVAKVGGLLHAILPTHPNGGSDQPTKFVDSGIAVLLDQLTRSGADRQRLIVRLAGGANMLVAPGFSQSFNIGSRNTEAALAVLSSLRLKIASREVGGNIGRTVRFYVADGRMTIRTMGNQEREF
jgi:chemotaxis protein CheD